MQSKKQYTNTLLAIVLILLSLAGMCSCAANKKMEKQREISKDSVDVFIPSHPPVIIPHTWREEMNK
jgi:hypothetical protein